MGQLGLDADAEAVYRILLKRPRAGVVEIAEGLGWPVERAKATLDALAELTLVRNSSEELGKVRLVNPEFGLAGLLQRQEQELAQRQQAVAATRLAITQVLSEYGEDQEAQTDEVRRYTGLDAINSQIERLAHGAESSVEVFAPGGAQTEASLEAARPLDQAAVERGVQLRYVYLDSVRNDPATLGYARWLHDIGGEVRVLPQLPPRMIIFDRRAAIVPIDPEAAARGVLILRGAGVVTALVSLFQQTWEQAQPLGVSRAATAQPDGLTGQERAVLDLLFEGHTDDVVARKLGVSVRTGRRITADLMARLGARSRYQAGALAMERGWLGPGAEIGEDPETD
ncbi:LuxR C-terminal-related transcriptional regulator [Streptomyces erythrochromogenes]|uniref:LuxR C-terminal-related transcriptional regulator n=1 Tax=Streptomyces erythrochromogenes TaxID=285574 RepID=UPI0002DF5E83|nr:LuxR C-terminal-related transcriptional regulator [Streptomyces erythrochromogenes]WST93797.1 LuxR C-terminal-related transcriptional regulator [Streptomyces erythrochromogenes]